MSNVKDEKKVDKKETFWTTTEKKHQEKPMDVKF